MVKRTCSVDGCEKPSRSRGMCKMHYSRWRRYGDASVKHMTGRRAAPVELRVWQYILITDDCWLWTGALHTHGYGMLNVDGLVRRAHRLVYEMLVGPIPDERPHLDHLCRVRHCVNPSHLEPVTNAVNVRRGAEARTHCKNGHPWSEENTYVRKDTGSRQCKTCGNDRRRKKKTSTPVEGP